MDASELGRQLAAQRKRTKKVCPECGESFLGLANQTYSPERCRETARKRRYRERLKASATKVGAKAGP
jgi:predicted RNA-binding Zn-ribbon protein involved in translation (DUF1610 family)